MSLAKALHLLAACTLALFALGANARAMDDLQTQNTSLEKIELLPLDGPHAWRAQAVELPQENDCRYDGHASGGLLGGLNRFGYVGGNPLSMTDPMGLMGGGGNHAPQPPLPAVDDPCVAKYINDNYGNTLGFITQISNLQQFFPSANPDYLNSAREGLNVVNEKLIATKGPGAVGNALMSRIPGNLAIGHVVGSGLAGFGGLASGVVEVAGAFMTPFGTTAMAQARAACSCRK